MKKEKELKLLKDKGLLFWKFKDEKFPMPDIPIVKQGKEETERLIEEAYQKGDIKPLRVMNIDIDQEVKEMPLSLALEFKTIIKEKLGIDYNIVEKRYFKVIEKILKKGKISNREEWEIVMNRIDEIFADKTKGDELDKLNEVILKYESKNGKKE